MGGFLIVMDMKTYEGCAESSADYLHASRNDLHDLLFTGLLYQLPEKEFAFVHSKDEES